MKKTILVMVLMLGIGLTSQAQELGLRFGDVTGGSVAVDALFSIKNSSVIHTDASFGNGGLGLDVLWDFVYLPLGNLPLDWYIGVGPSVFIGDNPTVSGMSEIGLSYKFREVPISISGDWRPTLTLIETTDLHFGFFGVNVRYVFK